MHIDCKQSFLILRRFAWWNSPFVLRDVKGWACASWADARNPTDGSFFRVSRHQHYLLFVPTLLHESVDLTEPEWNKNCDFGIIVMPSVYDDVAGLWLTRHVLYIWLSVVICKDSHRACEKTHEAHGFKSNLPAHTGIKHTTECTSTMRRKRTVHTEIASIQ